MQFTVLRTVDGRGGSACTDWQISHWRGDILVNELQKHTSYMASTMCVFLCMRRWEEKQKSQYHFLLFLIMFLCHNVLLPHLSCCLFFLKFSTHLKIWEKQTKCEKYLFFSLDDLSDLLAYDFWSRHFCTCSSSKGLWLLSWVWFSPKHIHLQGKWIPDLTEESGTHEVCFKLNPPQKNKNYLSLC